MKAKKTKLNAVERDLLEGLGGVLSSLKRGEQLREKYTVRRVVLDVRTKEYGPSDVKATRRLLKASQALFAQFLGVSVKTVCAWEGGQAPSAMACRFMDEIRHNPEYWQARLRQRAQMKTSGANHQRETMASKPTTTARSVKRRRPRRAKSA